MNNKHKITAYITLLILLFTLCINTAYASVQAEITYAPKGTRLFLRGADITLAEQMVTILAVKANASPVTPDDIKWLWQTKADAKGAYNISVPVSSADIYDISGGDYIIKVNAAGEEVTGSFKEAAVLSDMYDITVKPDLENGISLNISVENPFNSFDDFKAICGYYSRDGILVSVDIQTVYVSGENYKGKVDFSAIPEGAAYAKICFWESLNSLQPIKKADTLMLSGETFTFEENPELITKNPGKGWVRYGSNNSVYPGQVSDPVLAQKALDYAQTGYSRFTWAGFEPTEGDYQWKLIDDAINYWNSLGIKFAFSIMTLDSPNTPNAYHTPKWVFEKGAEYRLATHQSGNNVYTPVYNDPIYLECYTKLVKALAERYDGDERIAFIDARIQGIYGEGHNDALTNASPLLSTEDIINTHKIWGESFNKTQIVAMFQDTLDDVNYNIMHEDVVSYIKEAGIGMRCDGIMSENAWYRMLALMDKKDPVVFETAPRYNLMTSEQWDPQLYLQNVYFANPSYIDLGQWGVSTEDFIRNEEKLIKMLTNKIGYHFVLNELSLSTDTSNNIFTGTKWSNKGRNNLFEPCTVKFALLDEEGNAVATADTAFNPQNWHSGEQARESATVSFGDVENGNYRLAIGLFLNDNDNLPDYYIGNYGRTETGWYVVANAEKIDGSYVFSEYEPYIPNREPIERKNYGVIVNGDFEDTNGWTYTDSFVTDAEYSSGTHSLMLANAMQEIYIEPEYLYTLSFDAKTDKPINYTFTDESGTVVAQGTASASDSWVTHTVDFDYYDPGYKYFGECYYEGKIKIEFTAEAGANAYIDNVKINGKTPYSNYADPTNLICDYGQELADIGWYPRNNGKVTRTNEYANTGNWCGKLERSSNNDGAVIDIYEILKANGAGTYRFEVYVRPDIGSDKTMFITIDGCTEQGREDLPVASGGDFGYHQEDGVRGGNFIKLTHEFTLTEERLAKMSNAYMQIFSADSNTSYSNKAIYFDDARLTKID